MLKTSAYTQYNHQSQSNHTRNSCLSADANRKIQDGKTNA